ncbi:EAL domain-containing protein [Aerosakkonema funiforme]|uniref:sensor domain-containing protein n=1 Tax=Aerosakkonema funiforme TaxID=1246630 RepID=UPI0035BA5D84
MESEKRYCAAIEQPSGGIYFVDVDSKGILEANQAICNLLGYTQEEFLELTLYDILVVDREIINSDINLLLTEKQFLLISDGWNRRKDGSLVNVEVSLNLICCGGRKVICAVGRDITDRKQAEELLRKSEAANRALLNAIPDLMIRITGDGTYLDAIPAKNFQTWTTHRDMVGKNIYDVLPPEIARQRMYYIKQALSTGETQIYEFELTCEDAKVSYQEARIVVSGENEVLVIVREISDRKQAEATIQYHAFHDLLTGLPNRTMFDRHLSTALANADNSKTMLAVMFLDMDRFKTINDTLGHAVGDRLLQGFAERVKACLRESDIVARWGGDEFTVLVPQITSPEDAAKVGQRILEALKPAFYLQGHATGEETPPLHITSSIGIALYPHDGEDAETLLRNADAALYRAKEHGRNNYRFYKPEMNAQASQLLALENRLHQALEQREFEVYYQPQIHINTGEIIGMEALVRWRHPELGLVSPGQFIHLAEENGLIVPIGEWVLRTACAQNKAWQNAGFSPLRVAVNLSPRQFQQPNIASRVAMVLEETGLDPQYLELEITETTIMQNLDFASEMLRDLQTLGVYISIDDFGTGYSSLGYLKKFPFDKLKIDQSFVRDLKDNPQDIAIISAMITLGRGLNLKVVAEGVETREQLELLRSLQSEEMQGYLFSQPLAVEEATNLLHNPLIKTKIYCSTFCIACSQNKLLY